MTTLSDFEKKYETLANHELLGIVKYSDQYRPEAVAAAKNELQKRQLTEEDIETAKNLLHQPYNKSIKVIKSTIKNSSDKLIDTVNPIQSEKASVDKIISLIIIVFSVLIIYRLISEYNLIKGHLNEISRFPMISFSYLFPFLFMIVSTIMFATRKPIGWIVFTSYITFTAISGARMFVTSLNLKGAVSGLERFGMPSPIIVASQLAIIIAILYAICKENIRAAFIIDNKKMGSTLGIAALISIFLLLLV